MPLPPARGYISKTNNWQVDLYPNPAQDKVIFTSNIETENLTISISDLTGRIILNQQVKTNRNITILDLSLINGAYIVRISSNQNKILTKKLLIAK